MRLSLPVPLLLALLLSNQPTPSRCWVLVSPPSSSCDRRQRRGYRNVHLLGTTHAQRRQFCDYIDLSLSTSSTSTNDDDDNGGGADALEAALKTWQPRRGTFLGVRRRNSGSRSAQCWTTNKSRLSSSAGYYEDGDAPPPPPSPSIRAVMPDGGLSPCVIKVVGVGGGGSNAVDRMMDTRVGGVEFWAVNTDAQALGRSKAKGASILNIGGSVTRGLGAGGNPEIGRMAAEESRADIAAMVAGTDLCFVTSGMGGGTGSGAAPVVAEVAKESGALTIGIVTKPFLFEGARRMNQALAAIDKLKQHVDTVIVVSNNKLLEIIPENTPIERSFAVADDILRQGVVGISEIIIKPGLVNVDFADVRSVMHDAGTALMGIGTGVGKTRAEDAAAAAISSPLLDEPINRASGIVFNISGGSDMTLVEINRAAELIYASVEEDANVIFGALIDDALGDEMSITVLATGFAFDDRGGNSRGMKGGASASLSSSRTAPAPAPAPLPKEVAAEKKTKKFAVGMRGLRRGEGVAPATGDGKGEESISDGGGSNDDIPDFLKGLRKNKKR